MRRLALVAAVSVGLALAAVLPLGLVLPAGATEAPPTLDLVDEATQPFVGRDAPGVGVLVMKDGEILHMAGYGFADVDAGILVDEHTVFDLASVSKQMTALAAMLQIEDGDYSPDTDVAEILPAFGAGTGAERKVTVGDLIHHVSGLPDYLNADTLDYRGETTNAEVVAWVSGEPLDRPPGTAFSYSNTGYLVLGSLIAAADGAEDLEHVLKARIFDVVGMTATGLVGAAEGVDSVSLAMGYKGKAGDFSPSPEATVTEGDGNILTTLLDLASYERALATNALLDPEATTRLFSTGTFDDGSPVVRDDDPNAGYGYGWTLETVEGDDYASHTGSWMGTSTFYMRNLTSGLTVVVLANGEDMDCDVLAADIERAIETE